MHLPGTNLRIPLWVVVAILLINGAIIGWGVRAGWAADAWSSYGTWVAGFATLAAVGVALWQTKKAQDHAEDARTDAQSLLATELDAQRRHTQIMAIVPIWPKTSEFMEKTTDLLGQYQATIGHPAAHPAHLAATQAFEEWKIISMSTANAFVDSSLLVSELSTRKSISDTQDSYVRAREEIKAIHAELLQNGSFSLARIGAAQDHITAINSHRVQMHVNARKNIAQVPALSEHETENLQDASE